MADKLAQTYRELRDCEELLAVKLSQKFGDQAVDDELVGLLAAYCVNGSGFDQVQQWLREFEPTRYARLAEKLGAGKPRLSLTEKVAKSLFGE